jgi:elongation factor P
MIPVNQLRKGVVYEQDGQLWRVLEYEHYKPGRGGAIIRIKARNLRTGSTVNTTFPSGGTIQDVRLDHQTVQYLYNDGDMYHFMDVETFEQPALSKKFLVDVLPYLKEGTTLELELHEGEPIGVEMPITAELLVTFAEPGYAGDTATGATKEVTLETGYKLNVPLFVQEGDVLRIDTRTGEYLTRVK